MKDIRYGVGTRPIPLKAPSDIAATATASNWIDLKNAM